LPASISEEAEFLPIACLPLPLKAGAIVVLIVAKLAIAQGDPSRGEYRRLVGCDHIADFDFLAVGELFLCSKAEFFGLKIALLESSMLLVLALLAKQTLDLLPLAFIQHFQLGHSNLIQLYYIVYDEEELSVHCSPLAAALLGEGLELVLKLL
jgi:hypothetical protein